MTHFDQREQRVDTQLNIGHDLTILVRPVSKSTIQEKHNRSVLLARVESNWINNFLGKFLAEQVEVTLSLQQWPHAVENPWFDNVQELGEVAAASLLTDDQILQIYDEANGKVLILGEPGSGKTTLLLKLLRELLPRADRDELHPMPVLFLLSSWSARQPALEDWLVQELHTKYDIPRHMARRWVANNAILPLLDGLDEVEEHARAACINAINSYQDEQSMNPLVVCCRRADYEQVIARSQHKLRLRQAVCIQRLTYQQIDDALNKESVHLDALLAAIQSDPDMQELATSPFMLKVLTTIARETQLGKVLSSGSLDERRQQMFATYVESALTRRKRVTAYTPEQTLSWLAWLAQQLLTFHQAAFYIERMQFAWLAAEQARRLTMAVVFLFKLFIGVGTGLAGLLLFGLPGGLIFGLIGLYLAKPDLVNGEIEPAEKVSWSWSSVKQHLVDSLFSGIKIGLFVVLLTLLLSIVSILLSFVLQKDMVIGYFSLSSLLTDGIIIMLGGELLFIIQSGWTSELLDERLLIKPNQGIWRSGRHGLIVGLIFGGVGGLTLAFLANPLYGLVCGCILGLAVGVLNGGMACIKHALLRWSLWRAGVIPWHYSRLLDYGAERMFLSKVGGGYLFVHRLLLEHFATLYSPSLSRTKENHV
jgi:energy-coupling factor transporter ATP-binding protein EcfA2